jgi:uncharacterized protein (DUF433 family)
MDEGKSVARSFRLSSVTARLLDSETKISRQSRNALADRLLGEALRLEHHPMIRFHEGEARRRRALVAGTRLYVFQIIATLREHDGSIDDTAAYFDVSPRLVRAALDYYADFPDEVEADLDETQETAESERLRWERQQRALS